MLDRSIPHYGVLMTKTKTAVYPVHLLPSGYDFSLYTDGMEKDWAKIQSDIDHIEGYDKALEYFKKEFMHDVESLKRRCVFIKDSSGTFVATATLWYGDHFGYTEQRVHWVAVDTKHQHKGLAKALMTKIMDIYNELGYSDFIYLTTQTWSYPAINIYLSFGFSPYLGKKPVNWEGTDEKFEHDNLPAWQLIMDKISKRT